MNERHQHRKSRRALASNCQHLDDGRKGYSSGVLAYLDVASQLTATAVGGFHPIQTRQRRIAVAVVFCPASQQFVAYREHEVGRLAQVLHEVDLVIGYNLRGFDLELLRGYPGTDVDGIQASDMSEDLRRISGCRWHLDVLAQSTLDLPPSVGGDDVTAMFGRGEFAGCAAACREGVRRIAQLHQFGVARGLVYGRRPDDNVRVSIPVQW